MKRATTQAWIVFVLAIAAIPVCAQEPDASEILRAARMNPLNQSAQLKARLRTDSSRTPFNIVLEDGRVNYIFTDPEQVISLEFSENSSKLTERVGGKSAAVRSAQFAEPVRDTAITYEDLALQFLYWPRAKLLGDELIRTRRAWKLEVQAPRGQSQYGVARLWIDQESGALVRVEGYNTDGRLTKRFEVISAQKIDGLWMLKTMRVESVDPESRKVTDRTYLEVLGKL